MQRYLFVRPDLSADANGGDSVVYRRVETFLRERFEVTVLSLRPAGRARQLWGVAAGLPLEPARYRTAENQRRLEAELRCGYDAVLYGHEAVFPLGLAAPRAGSRIFYAHNVQSGVSARRHSWVDSLIALTAVRFDRAWTADLDDRVVCISNNDIAALRAIGVDRKDIHLAPPRAPPALPLVDEATVITEAVLTGSYGWWRKRQDLERFAAGDPLPYPVLASDSRALELLGAQARAVDPKHVDWSAGLRPAIVTDRFLGGFKLKTLEYVALNCAVFSFCDVRAEFADLPHAAEFVRVVGSKNELRLAIASLTDQPERPLIDRFRAFKAACLEKYDWDRCLAALVPTSAA